MAKHQQYAVPDRNTVFSRFSKAVPESFGLSFSRSASQNCNTSCRLWASCYASRIERLYTGLQRKLAEHYDKGALWVVNRALAQLPKDRPIRWARLSVDGSLPSKSTMSPRRWRAFVRRLRELIERAQSQGALWHIPVESPAKARSYRAALRGLGVVVRRSSQARTLQKLLASDDHCSWTVGKIHSGPVPKSEVSDNTSLALLCASQIRESGRTCVICPAIARNAKCGQCTACADARVDIVLYPFHP